MERIAVVTGAGSGIGRAAALALMDAGFVAILAGRRIDALEATAASARAGTALPVATNVADPASVTALFETVARTYGRIDLLFNNGGNRDVRAPSTKSAMTRGARSSQSISRARSSARSPPSRR